MNVKEIKEMVALMNESGLMELEIEKEGLKLRLKKSAGGIQQELSVVPNLQIASPSVVAPSGPAVKETEPSLKGLVEVKSPMVGTFYRAPAPDAPPYVQEGQKIEKGQVVCIIEAMKLMNEIKSEVSGRVVKILVENADPVEFGHILFLIDPAK